MNGVVESFPVWFWVVISIIIVWSSIWKALALWKSARKNHIVWFIVFIILGTAGILEILYIYVFSRCCEKKKPQKQKQKGK